MKRRAASRAAGRHGKVDGVALAFARDRSGRLVPAAALDGSTRRSRAPFSCPGCGDELTAKLGAVRARHFAHRPGAACPLTAPETALHFNAKARLLDLCALAFGRERTVVVRTRCARCRRPVRRDLATAGDAAADEGAVAGRRADVLVTWRGAPALALEVLVTHAVETEKMAALAAAGVAVVELDARAEWETTGPEGVIELVCVGSSGLPPCRACRTEALAEADRAAGGEAAQVAELESYRARGLLRIDAVGAEIPGARVRHARVKVSKNGRLPDPVPESFREPLDAVRPDPRSERHDSRSGGQNEERVKAASNPFASLAARFACPDCGGRRLDPSPRLALHPCPGQGARPVAWVGYDGGLAVLSWWRR